MNNHSDDSNDFFNLETIETVQSERISTSRVIDLRRSPRVDTSFKARMISGNGKVEGTVSNLSRSGLRFEAGNKLPDLLMKGNRQESGHLPEIVEICFDVPVHGDTDMPIVVQARAAYIIDDNNGNYMCGVEFKVFAEGEQVLEDYLYSKGITK